MTSPKFSLARPILLAALFLPSLPQALAAQSPLHLQGQVRDTDGRTVPDASITAEGSHGKISATADDTGHFHLDYPDSSTPLTLRATARSLESDPIQLSPQSPPADLAIVLHLSAVAEQVTVTSTRSSLDLPATANTVYTLDAKTLHTYPAITLDDQLRQQAGFELFRRSSSRTQNPTSQGISLRGLGSTAVSRTLVLENNVPMNDPFGGWIHWDEVPNEAIDAVTIATGGGSDLYGSSALGGVVDVVPARPTTARFDASAFGGGQDSSLVGLRGDLGNPHWRQLLAADSYRTAGYIIAAPANAGPVDVPANVHYQSVRSETDYIFSNTNRAFLTGNMLNEAHGNGTPLTTNGTRLWRYILGDDWSAGHQTNGRVRIFGSDEAYRQSFSSVSSVHTNRDTEALTRLQHVRTQELGASTDATVAFSRIAFVAGVDIRDIRGTDYENPIKANAITGIFDASARQRFVGGFGEALASAHHGLFKDFSAALSLRLDSAANLDTRTITQTNPAPIPPAVPTANRSEFIASPRFGIVRQVTSRATIHAAVFRAFRTPTMNELYRTGQIGPQVTQANPSLLSERATGWETGTTFTTRPVALSATYFWTQINRPVAAVLIVAPNTYKRENLGQIVSQGTELRLDLYRSKPISATVGYQYSHAIVTRYNPPPPTQSLVGNWIPDVPRQNFTAQLRAANHRLGELTLAARATGHVWDDSLNTNELHPFFQLDLFARHDFGPRWSASVTLNNLLNQRPEVSFTPPLLTLGSPFLAQGGIAFHWNKDRPR
ncbi:MAG TPA: TonB-dependent receptor [Acidobacteriaceae bacterium]|nr:TonB-dependent receptor [Acidobacteriaceae bacterium]